MTCLHTASSRYFVPRRVLERLERHPETVLRGKRIADVAVLFVDVQNCSSLCEELAPPVMNRLLEVAFGDFFDCVYDAGGDVNEIMGDGFMALFEGCSPCENARAAAKAALAIRQHVHTCQETAGVPEVPFVVNMGLHAGEAFVGMTRFAGRYGERWTYTASGPVTNAAARLCTLAQDGAILLSEVIASCLVDAYVLQPQGVYHFRNIHHPLGVYRLCDLKPVD